MSADRRHDNDRGGPPCCIDRILEYHDQELYRKLIDVDERWCHRRGRRDQVSYCVFRRVKSVVGSAAARYNLNVMISSVLNGELFQPIEGPEVRYEVRG